MDEIAVEMEEAKDCGNYALQEELQKTKEFILQMLGSGLGLKGRRKATSEYRRLRDRVNKALRRALRAFKDDSPMGRHLSTALHSGTEWSYRPEIEIPWEL